MGKDGQDEHGYVDLDGPPVTRRRLLRAGIGTLAAATASPLIAACGSTVKSSTSTKSSSSGGKGELASFRENGVRLGTTELPPFVEMKGGKATGFFVEIPELVLKKLGVTKFTSVAGEFGAAIPGLQAGRLDIACVGLYMTEARCKAIRFSDPIIDDFEAFVVAKGNPLKLETFADVMKTKARLGLVNGSFGVELAAKEKVPSSQIQHYPELTSSLDALKAGRVDAVIWDIVTMGYYLTLPPYKDFTVSEPLVAAGKYGVGLGFKQNATELQTAFNTEMVKLSKEGAFTSIFNKWGVPKEASEPAEGQTWQEACAGLST